MAPRGFGVPALFDVIALLLVLTSCFAWLNRVLTRLPNTIGLLLMGLLASLALMAIEFAFPSSKIFEQMIELVRDIDFSRTFLNWMLGVLLFAGALQIDVSSLRERKWIVATLATTGVFISTVVVAVAFWVVSIAIGVPVPFIWALVFGALISPTDPIAVLSTLKEVQLPGYLNVDMSGESLFNDGVGVVLFTLLVAVATGGKDGSFGLANFFQLFLVEAVGGGVLGFVTGYIAYRAMRFIDDYSLKVMISLALATATYALAARLHVSGPIAVVVAGVLIGNQGATRAMRVTTRQYFFGFWTLVDEILNSVLFLLIGLEVLVLTFDTSLIPLAIAAVPIVLVARFLAVGLPVLGLGLRYRFERWTIPILTWAGIRGGISIALVLSLGDTEFKPALSAATYAVAIFTMVVQGLTLGWLVRTLSNRPPGGGANA